MLHRRSVVRLVLDGAVWIWVSLHLATDHSVTAVSASPSLASASLAPNSMYCTIVNASVREGRTLRMVEDISSITRSEVLVGKKFPHFQATYHQKKKIFFFSLECSFHILL